jgi:hypothetical protein
LATAHLGRVCPRSPAVGHCDVLQCGFRSNGPSGQGGQLIEVVVAQTQAREVGMFGELKDVRTQGTRQVLQAHRCGLLRHGTVKPYEITNFNTVRERVDLSVAFPGERSSLQKQHFTETCAVPVVYLSVGEV